MSATSTELVFVPCPGAVPADGVCVFLRCADIRLSGREVGASNSLEGGTFAQRRRHRFTANGSGRLGSTLFAVIGQPPLRRTLREVVNKWNSAGAVIVRIRVVATSHVDSDVVADGWRRSCDPLRAQENRTSLRIAVDDPRRSSGQGAARYAST